MLRVNEKYFTSQLQLCKDDFWQLYDKGDSNTGVFLWIFRNFLDQLFYRTPLGDCILKKHSNILRSKKAYGLNIAESIIYVKECFLCFFLPWKIYYRYKSISTSKRLSIYLPVYLSIYLSIYWSIYLSNQLTVYPIIHPS